MEKHVRTVILKKEGGIATIVLNRPERRNAVTDQMTEEMIAVLRDIAADDAIKVVILTGAGDDFCVGADLPGVEDFTFKKSRQGEDTRRYLRWQQQVVYALYTLEKPTIAMINGVAAGGGFDWALACDIRVGSEKARFRSYMQIGLIPGQGGAWLMFHHMGYAKACEMMFTGDIVGAQEAERMGLLNRVVPAEALEAETMNLARRIAENSAPAIRHAKMLLRHAAQVDFMAALEEASLSQPIVSATDETAEVSRRFLEKRKPKAS